ncbi:hypothetical protein V6N12_072225 [Hibiscus sabdariffa]|uniref:Uncharacterized protein n=1 Tax=Hibiscus sabdariffa TaxID=183260 RepID=A0ABR2FM33_9ROSI
MKPSLVTAVDDPSQGPRVQGQKVKTDDFWNSSACEMEHSGVQPQRSMSSNNGSSLDPSSSTSQPSEFAFSFGTKQGNNGLEIRSMRNGCNLKNPK